MGECIASTRAKQEPLIGTLGIPAGNLFYSQTTSIYDVMNRPKHFGGEFTELCLKVTISRLLIFEMV